MITHAPNGLFYAFELIPDLFEYLRKKCSVQGSVSIHRIALSDQADEVSFNYVASNPGYSGLLKRKYDRPHEEDMQITVRTGLLDDFVAPGQRVGLIKIDVGISGDACARRVLATSRPVVLFEHGMGAADVLWNSIRSHLRFPHHGVPSGCLAARPILARPSAAEPRSIRERVWSRLLLRRHPG